MKPLGTQLAEQTTRMRLLTDRAQKVLLAVINDSNSTGNVNTCLQAINMLESTVEGLESHFNKQLNTYLQKIRNESLSSYVPR